MSKTLLLDNDSQLPQNKPVIKEQEYFARKNNLLEEFNDPPPPIVTSNLSEEEKKRWKYIIEHNGYMILANTPAEALKQKEYIMDSLDNWRVPGGIMTIAEFTELYKKITITSENDDEQNLLDDVDNYKSDPNYADPSLPQSKNYTVRPEDFTF